MKIVVIDYNYKTYNPKSQHYCPIYYCSRLWRYWHIDCMSILLQYVLVLDTNMWKNLITL